MNYFKISYGSNEFLCLEAEEEEKRRRIAARVSANINEKKKPKPAPPPPKQKNPKNYDVKFKIHKSHKLEKPPADKGKPGSNKKQDSNKDLTKLKQKVPHPDKSKLKHSESKPKSSSGNPKGDSLKIDRHKNEHRKEKERTINNNKTKKQKPSQSNNGLNFNDLMKFAKLNSENPGSGAIQKQKEELKKKSTPKTTQSNPFDPDRNLKIKKSNDPNRNNNNNKPSKADQIKHSSNGDRHRTNDKQRIESDRHLNMKRKHDERGGGPPSKQSKPLESRNLQVSKQKQQQLSRSKPQQKVASKDLSRCDMKERPQRGLVVETVSVSKSNGNKDRMMRPPSHKHDGKAIRSVDRQQVSAYKRGGGSKGIEAQFRGGGIEAQFGGRNNKNGVVKKSSTNKKKAEEYEDEFEKEERELARKRKLFEMRRATG